MFHCCFYFCVLIVLTMHNLKKSFISTDMLGLGAHPSQKKREGIMKEPDLKSSASPRWQSWSWGWWQDSDFEEDETHWFDKAECPLSLSWKEVNFHPSPSWWAWERGAHLPTLLPAWGTVDLALECDLVIRREKGYKVERAHDWGQNE